MAYRYTVSNLKDLHGEDSTWRDEACATRAANAFVNSVKTELGRDVSVEVYKGPKGWHWKMVTA